MTKNDFILMHISNGLVAYDVSVSNSGKSPRFKDSSKEDKRLLVMVFQNQANEIWNNISEDLK